MLCSVSFENRYAMVNVCRVITVMPPTSLQKPLFPKTVHFRITFNDRMPMAFLLLHEHSSYWNRTYRNKLETLLILNVNSVWKRTEEIEQNWTNTHRYTSVIEWREKNWKKNISHRFIDIYFHSVRHNQRLECSGINCLPFILYKYTHLRQHKYYACAQRVE